MAATKLDRWLILAVAENVVREARRVDASYVPGPDGQLPKTYPRFCRDGADFATGTCARPVRLHISGYSLGAAMATITNYYVWSNMKDKRSTEATVVDGFRVEGGLKDLLDFAPCRGGGDSCIRGFGEPLQTMQDEAKKAAVRRYRNVNAGTGPYLVIGGAPALFWGQHSIRHYQKTVPVTMRRRMITCSKHVIGGVELHGGDLVGAQLSIDHNKKWGMYQTRDNDMQCAWSSGDDCFNLLGLGGPKSTGIWSCHDPGRVLVGAANCGPVDSETCKQKCYPEGGAADAPINSACQGAGNAAKKAAVCGWEPDSKEWFPAQNDEGYMNNFGVAGSASNGGKAEGTVWAAQSGSKRPFTTFSLGDKCARVPEPQALDITR